MSTENIVVEWSTHAGGHQVTLTKKPDGGEWQVSTGAALPGTQTLYGSVLSSTAEHETLDVLRRALGSQLGLSGDEVSAEPAGVWLSHQGAVPPELANGLVLFGSNTAHDHSHSGSPAHEDELTPLSFDMADELVARFGGWKVHIYADEHAPPHFHIKAGSEQASFAIDDCRRVDGTAFKHAAVRKWWKANEKTLKQTWNATRPGDCPVGPIVD